MHTRIAAPRRLSHLTFSLAALLAALPSLASGQTVGYAAEGGADYLRWDEDLGLDEGWIWGGALTFELGPRVRLSPFYLKGTEFEADPSSVDGLTGAEPFTFDARHVGASLDIDIATGNVTPFLRAGGGILRLDPEGRDAVERIALTYGGGLRFGLGRAGVRVFAQGTSYRLSPERLYATAEVEGEEDARRNLVAGARVSIPLSAMPDDPGVGLSGASVPIGVFAGEFNFDDASGLPDQRIAGVRAGIAFNPLVSLSGFYWRGVNDDFDALREVHGYGAEGRFDLGSGTGISPFVVAGGARMDYPEATDDTPDDEPFVGRDDQTALILGGGLAMRLTDRIDLEVSARDYLLDTSGELEDASDPGELTSNWLFSAGLDLKIGGASVDSRRQSRTADAEAERRRLQARVDSLQSSLDEARSNRLRAADAGAESMVVQRRAITSSDSMPMVRMQRMLRTPSGEVITLPVLEEGAIYIRFGPDGADTRAPAAEGMRLDRSELMQMIRDEIDRGSAAADTSGGAMAAAEMERRILDRLEQRGLLADSVSQPARADAPSPAVLERLDAIEAEVMRRLDTIEARQEAQPAVERTSPGSGAAARPAAAGPDSEEETAWDRMGRFNSRRTLPFGAIGFTETDAQAVFGVRFDFGPLSAGSRLNLVPEASFAFGGDETALTVMANVQYPFADLGTARDIEPYLVGGAGFYSPTFLGVNTGIGLEFDLRNVDRGDPLRSYIELQGLNLFDETRLLFGLSLQR